MPSTPPDLTGQVLSQRFRVRQRVAAGGIATIYEVEHLITRRLGALKLLHPLYAASSEAVERLIREASAASRIANPHVVETLDAGRLDTGEPYVFMELLAGESLASLLERQGRVPFTQAMDIARQAGTGLEATHKAGIVHRDIKPANLFLVAKPKGFLKLLDFGVSKFSAFGLDTLTQEGRALGTFLYMAPEQMTGAKNVDARADIYALGVVLYECVTGCLPFAAKSIPELALRMGQNDYTPASRLRSDTPVGFDTLMARCLRADPAQRCPTMKDFLAELAAIHQRSSISQTLSIGAMSNVRFAPPAAPAKLEPKPVPVAQVDTIHPQSTKRPR